MNPITEMNLAIAKALGVSDAERAASITLELRPNELPLITVERKVLSGDRIVSSIEALSIVSVAR